MEIGSILSKVFIKLPYLEKIVYQINFEHIQETDEVAFLKGKTIFYTNSLFLDFSDEEQAFIVAHEVMHYFIHEKNVWMDMSKYDADLANFVEDAQINQILVKQNFIAPKDIVLLEDALNYEFDDLCNKLLPMKKELLSGDNWSKYSNISDILNSRGIITNQNKGL